MGRRVVFLVGTFDKCGGKRGGDYLEPATMDFLAEIEQEYDLEGHIVFAVTQRTRAGDEKSVKIGDIHAERERVVREIQEVEPEYVFLLGRSALFCAFGRGGITLDEHRRRSLQCEGFPERTYLVDGLSRVQAQSGIAKWVKRDIGAALNGWDKTEWGEYTLMLPMDMLGDQQLKERVQGMYPDMLYAPWHECPAELYSLDAGTMVGFDLETYPGLDPWAPDARIRMAMFSVSVGRAYIVQCPADSSLPKWAEDLLADDTIIKCGSNIAFDYKWCHRFGYQVNNMWDTAAAEHVIDTEDPNTGLKFLTFNYLPRLGDYSREHRDLVKERGGWEFVRDDEQYLYAGADAEASVAAGLGQWAIMHDRKLHYPMSLVMDLYPILTDMETAGTAVDRVMLTKLDDSYNTHLCKLRKDICKVLGPINLNSAPQLADALHKVVPDILLSKWDTKKFWADKYGDEDKVSTAKAILEREAEKHPIIALVLAYRKWSKLHGTYVTGTIEKHLREHGGGAFVHPSFNQNRVKTHRLSCSAPNVMNIPKSLPVPDADHPAETDEQMQWEFDNLNIKSMFVSRFEGGSILEADFGQAELRLAAMESGDKAMLKAFNDRLDIHKATAALVSGKPLGEVTKQERQHAKAINFGIIYGQGDTALGAAIGQSKHGAEKYRADYFATFPQLKEYIDECNEQVKTDMSVTTIFGFTRTFVEPPTGPNIKDQWNQWPAWRIFRQVFNTRVQNAAACVTFVALIEVNRQMKEAGFKSVLVDIVYDSIVVDVYPGELEELAVMMKEVMEHPPTERYGVTLAVPMAVDVEAGPSWGQIKELDMG
jgi:DNA polymerase I-like protein with 3'-5' exonuclease and polymerase domains